MESLKFRKISEKCQLKRDILCKNFRRYTQPIAFFSLSSPFFYGCPSPPPQPPSLRFRRPLLGGGGGSSSSSTPHGTFQHLHPGTNIGEQNQQQFNNNSQMMMMVAAAAGPMGQFHPQMFPLQQQHPMGHMSPVLVPQPLPPPPPSMRLMSRYGSSGSSPPRPGRECKFCKNNGETVQLYRSHVIRNPATVRINPTKAPGDLELISEKNPQLKLGAPLKKLC